jgi:1-acyl-sn-glycerol-3-phosphate acyltransferase
MARPSIVYSLLALSSQPLRLLYRMDAGGKENLPAEGGFVLAANHTSNFDPWAVGLPLYPDRFLRFMGKSELFRWPVGPVIEAGGAFKVNRGQGDLEAIAKAVDLVKAGEVVVMFPEGTRRKKGIVKKHEARPHSGAARIAGDAGVPLVPAAIKGTDRLARLAKVEVAYGRPVEQTEDVHETTERLMTEIERLYATL